MSGVSGVESVRLAAVAVLEQGAVFVEGLDDGCYSKSSSAVGATIGQHVRHALDHFAALLDGYEASDRDEPGPVSYDRRDRGTSIETDRGEAVAQIRVLQGQLGSLDDVQLEWPMTIRVMTTADGPEVELPSTLARELAFVTHHAIHHWAICKVASRELGVSCAEGFGVAPSTLAFEAE